MPDGIKVGGVYGEFDLQTGEAERRLAEVERRMKALHQDLQTGAVHADRFEGELEDLSREAGILRERIAAAGQGVQVFGRSAAEAAVGAGRVAAGMQQAGRSAGSSAQFFLFLGQTIDDAQYGFRSIVNNIPQLALVTGQAFGASTESALKFGGAVAIAAVGINQWIKNADDLGQILADIEPPRFLVDAGIIDAVAAGWDRVGDAVATVYGTLSNIDRLTVVTGENLKGIADQVAAAREQVQADIEAAAKASQAVAGVGAAGDAGRAAAVRQAIELEGGGRALSERLFARLSAGLSDEQLAIERAQPGGGTRSVRELMQAAVDRTIADALTGDAGAVAGLSRRVGGNFALNLQNALPENQQAARESQRRVEEVARENDRREERRRRERDQEVESVAGNVRDFAFRDLERRGMFGPDLPEEDLDHDLREQIKERMLAAGYELEEAVLLLPDVFKRVKDEFEAEVRKRVLTGGGTEAEARSAMAAERDREDRAAALKAAEQADPSIRARAERFATMAFLSGGLAGGRFREEVSRTLRNRGLSDEQADLAAGQIAGQAGIAGQQFAGQTQQQLFESMLQSRRGPEQFDASQLLERVQAGVGNRDLQREQVNLTKQIEAHLKKLVDQEQRAEVTRLS